MGRSSFPEGAALVGVDPISVTDPALNAPALNANVSRRVNSSVKLLALLFVRTYYAKL
jgi:hypothetical protein